VYGVAQTTLRLWGPDGGELDFDVLAADIATEARLALTLTDALVEPVNVQRRPGSGPGGTTRRSRNRQHPCRIRL
jgi:hypothetical protein